MAPAMSGASDGWVSVEEAASRLGVSENTVRRRVRAGTLEGFREQRPQGEVYRVLASALPSASNLTPPDTLEAEAPDLASAIRAALDPYIALNERIAELYAGAVAEVTALERENGTLQADARHLTEQLAAEVTRREAAEAELDRLRAIPWWRWWRTS